MRRIAMILLLLVMAAGCHAQAPAGPQLDPMVAKQVRALYKLPAFVDVTVAGRQPSKDFPGFTQLAVKLSYGGTEQTRDLLLSADGKSLYTVVRMDMTRDPQAEMMSKIDLAGRPVRGNKDAKVTVVVYDDFQCPYCSRIHKTLNDLLKSYGDRIKIVYKDFPLREIHPWAERAAVDSGCLAAQSPGAYWDFADYVHANPEVIRGDKRPVEGQRAEVDRITTDIGKRHAVNEAALKSCLDAQSTTALKASMSEAESLGVEATPALVINGSKMDGALGEEELRLILDRELQNAGVGAPKAAPGQ
jgi:protein-disulfide isomerase